MPIQVEMVILSSSEAVSRGVCPGLISLSDGGGSDCLQSFEPGPESFRTFLPPEGAF